MFIATSVTICLFLIAATILPATSAEGLGAILGIEITGGLHTKIIIRNVGDTDAVFVNINVSLKGGFVKKINISYSGFVGSLPPHNDMEDLVITFPSDQLIGFGKFTITATSDSLLTSSVEEELVRIFNYPSFSINYFSIDNVTYFNTFLLSNIPHGKENKKSSNLC